MAEKNSDLRKKILTLLEQYITLSTREISEEIGATYATTLKYLEILHASDQIDNKVFGKTKVWSLKKDDPFDLDPSDILYLLIKDLAKNAQSYDSLINILNTHYSKAIEIHREKLKKLVGQELFKKYLELEKNEKWEKIDDYDIQQDNPNAIKIKIFDCKYKFGCCAHLSEENIKICCIIGQKFAYLLKSILSQDFRLQLTDFSLDPSFCVVQYEKSN
jgi:predicted ArsR family transcriptional regulator